MKIEQGEEEDLLTVLCFTPEYFGVLRLILQGASDLEVVKI